MTSTSTSTDQPRPEYPRPQFVRPDWLNLNGAGSSRSTAATAASSAACSTASLRAARSWCRSARSRSCPGIGDADFMEAVWYRRTISVPEEWRGRNVLVHFQAVDHDATVWVRRRRGGPAPRRLHPLHRRPRRVAGGEVTLVVRARDHQAGPQARGKQSDQYGNHELPLHPHHRHLADGVAGAGADIAPAPAPDHPGRRRQRLPRRAPAGRAASRAHASRRPLTDEAGVVVDRAGPRRPRPRAVRLDPHRPRRPPHAVVARGPAPVRPVSSSSWTPAAPWSTSATSYAGLRSVTIDGKAVSCSTASPSSSGWCSTRATTPTAC